MDDDRRRRRTRPLLNLDWDRLVLIAFVGLQAVVVIALLIAVAYVATR